MSRQRTSNRVGFTLVELVAAIAISSIIVLAMASSMAIAMRTGDPTATPSVATNEGCNLLNEIAAELEVVQSISEQTAAAITFTVPDRDLDTNPETIRFAWSGTTGDPLTRQYNGGAVKNIAEDVHLFDLQYVQPASNVEYATVTLQITSDARCSVRTSVPFPNLP